MALCAGKQDVFLTLSQHSYTAVTFSDLNPTGLLPCVASLLLPLMHTPCSRRCAGCSALRVPFRRKPGPEIPHHPCPWLLIPYTEPPQDDASGATIISWGHGKGVLPSQKIRRQFHPQPILSAQDLEPFSVFAFVLGLNMCLAISLSYLKCRGVVRLPNLTQPVTSANGWPVSIKPFYLFHLGWYTSW